MACALGMVSHVQLYTAVTKCEKDGKLYVERVPESEQGFEHLTKRKDMVVSQDGHSLLC